MGSPVSKKEAKTDGLEDTGKGSHCNSVKRTLLREYLRDELYKRTLAYIMSGQIAEELCLRYIRWAQS